MARKLRFAPPGYWYHVTQRGNYRQKTFFSSADYQFFLQLLADQAALCQVDILGLCLMPNHFHLIAQPRAEHALSHLLQRVTSQYAYTLHHRLRRHGRLWQGRFFSCLLGSDEYLATALRYVELNPVRAKMVDSAEHYRWSSAADHCRGPANTLPSSTAESVDPPQFADWLTPPAEFQALTAPVTADWPAYLAAGENRRQLRALRLATRHERVYSSPEFLAQLEHHHGVSLQPRPTGRPRKEPGSALALAAPSAALVSF